MEDKIINKKLDEIKRNLDVIVISENNLDSNLKTKINGASAQDIADIQSSILSLQTNKVSVAQGVNNASRNVVTDVSGNITTESKPSIPTVNNGKLTIQKNGVEVSAFTANDSNNVTANIVVPTTAADVGAVPTTRTINNKALSVNVSLTSSDVGALSTATAYGASLKVSSNKLYLKDQNSNNLGSGINIVQGVTLNGTSTRTPSFYAPTTAGTSGQILTSTGSGAPTWQEISGGGTQIEDNLSSTSTTSALSANQGRVLNNNLSGKAACNCANLSSSNIESWQSALNNLLKPSLSDSSAHTQMGQAVIVESYLSSDKKTWYRLWSDGWKECGMFWSGSSNEISFTFPLTFSNNKYVVVANCNVDGRLSVVRPQNFYTSSVVLRTGDGGSYYTANTVWVYCCGF